MGLHRKAATSMAVPDGINDVDDDEAALLAYDSGHLCGRCNDPIMLVDEVYSLQVVIANIGENGGIEFSLALNEAGDDCLYEPIFFEIDCMEASAEDLVDIIEDEEPLADPYGILQCSLCKSDIRQGEILGLAEWGEIRASTKTPNGEASYTFWTEDKNPKVLCIGCLKRMDDDVHELWDEGVDQQGECEVGTYSRCWRFGCNQEHCMYREANE